METAVKPIKRSTELVPLSREHHEGLLLVWKIRQGVRNAAPTKLMADYCQWFWNTYLAAHCQKEEEVLSAILSAEHPMMVKMLDEHEAIRNKIKQLGEYTSVESLLRLAQVLGYHIRFEERQLFPLIEHIATKPQLKKIQNNLSGYHTPSAVWSDEFWLRKK
jgi:hemerythrin-like domain-containing protein